MKEIIKITFESETQKCVISIQGDGEEISTASMSFEPELKNGEEYDLCTCMAIKYMQSLTNKDE